MDEAQSNPPPIASSCKPFQLGVLLVHGIGTPPSGDTLVRWGDTLLKTIGLATRGRVVVAVERADPGPGPERGDGHAEMVVELRAGDDPERWLVSEGWWAKSFPAPSYGELVSWSMRALPWFVAIHIARRYWQASRGRGSAKVIALAGALGKLVIAFALTPLFLVLLALVLVLALLPISQLRTLILSAQSALTATVGDSLAFVESPVRAALIRTRILDGLRRLQSACERTVIVAHSQGAAATLDALGGIAEQVYETEHEVRASGLVPDALLTFGAGTNQLVSQKVLSAGLTKKIAVNPAFYAIGALLAAAVAFACLYADVSAGRTTVPSILHAAALLVISTAVFGLLGWVIAKTADGLARRWPKLSQRAERIKFWGWLTLFLGPIALMIYAQRTGLPLATVTFLILALLILLVSLAMILSLDMEKVVTAPVRKPPRLKRWVDVYASADPVPNGPTRTAGAGAPESVQIWNLDSLFADHTTYWENIDGFVLRAVRICAETASSPWTTALPLETIAVDERAAWRCRFLRIARWSTYAIWLFLGAFLWIMYKDRMPLPFDLPGWIPPAAAGFALLAAIIAVAAWGTSRVLRWIWGSWVRAEQEAVLVQQVAQLEVKDSGLVGMGVVVLMLLIAAFGLMSEDITLASLVADPSQLVMVPLVAFGFSAFSTLVLLKLIRPPLASRVDITSSPTGDLRVDEKH